MFVIFAHLAGCALHIYAWVPVLTCAHSCVIFAQLVMQVFCVGEVEVCHVAGCLCCSIMRALHYTYTHRHTHRDTDTDTHTHTHTLSVRHTQFPYLRCHHDSGHKFITKGHWARLKCKAPAVTFIELLTRATNRDTNTVESNTYLHKTYTTWSQYEEWIFTWTHIPTVTHTTSVFTTTSLQRSTSQALKQLLKPVRLSIPAIGHLWN